MWSDQTIGRPPGSPRSRRPVLFYVFALNQPRQSCGAIRPIDPIALKTEGARVV